jgi:hypothetical protein
MAERKGFELSVRFRTAKSRLIRKLQSRRALQRIIGGKHPLCGGEEVRFGVALRSSISKNPPNPQLKRVTSDWWLELGVRLDWSE